MLTLWITLSPKLIDYTKQLTCCPKPILEQSKASIVLFLNVAIWPQAASKRWSAQTAAFLYSFFTMLQDTYTVAIWFFFHETNILLKTAKE
jgi:hypothetical protein